MKLPFTSLTVPFARFRLHLAVGLGVALLAGGLKAQTYDLSAGFSATSNPNFPWKSGWVGSLGGAFTPLAVAHTSTADGGQQVPSWQLSSFQTPAVYKNTSGTTITVGGGAASLPAGTVWFHPGENGRPENLGVIRFTVPCQSGTYSIQAQVSPIYPSFPQGDTDFHIAINGTEVFGRFLAPSESASYTANHTLNEGDTVDFAIGRGADGNQYGSGLRIAATLTFTGSPPPPALQVASAVSILDVTLFNINYQGTPKFCGRTFYRQCSVSGSWNNRCNGTPTSVSAAATFQPFASIAQSAYDPCPGAFDGLLPAAPPAPLSFSETGITCRLTANEYDCWDGNYVLSLPMTPDQLIAACVGYLNQVDLSTVPFGMQRTVVNDPVTGAPVFSDHFLGEQPWPDFCVDFAGPPKLAASLSIRYVGPNWVLHCESQGGSRVYMPAYRIIVSATRSRFCATSPWCKRTRGPRWVDPDWTNTCTSQQGACAVTQCTHYLGASGVIEVPNTQETVHIELCTYPASPCNPTPIPFP